MHVSQCNGRLQEDYLTGYQGRHVADDDPRNRKGVRGNVWDGTLCCVGATSCHES